MEGLGSISRREFFKKATIISTALAAASPQPIIRGDNKIRCGFIGVGGRGTGLLQETLNFADVDVVAICDINEANLNRAIDITEKARGMKPRGYSRGPYDYRTLLKRRDIDAVVIATPCNWHAPMYLDTISAGKHLYGEKPMCISVKEAFDIVEAAERAPKLVLQIGFQRRANPRYQEAIKLIHEGELGELIEARAAWSNAWGPLRGWFSKKEQSGDWVIEQACHTWDVYNWITQTTPLRAYAVARKDLYTEGEPDRNVADYYCAIVEYPKGFALSFFHTWLAPDAYPFAIGYEQVIGRKGGCEVGAGRFVYKDRGKPERRVGRDVNDTRECLRAFFDCIYEGKPPISGVYNGRDATLVGLMVRMAYDKHKVVTWEEVLRAR